MTQNKEEIPLPNTKIKDQQLNTIQLGSKGLH